MGAQQVGGLFDMRLCYEDEKGQFHLCPCQAPDLWNALFCVVSYPFGCGCIESEGIPKDGPGSGSLILIQAAVVPGGTGKLEVQGKLLPFMRHNVEMMGCDSDLG